MGGRIQSSAWKPRKDWTSSFRLMALGMGRFVTEVLGSVSKFASLASWSEPALIWDQNTQCSRDAAPRDKLVATVSETPANLLAA